MFGCLCFAHQARRDRVNSVCEAEGVSLLDFRLERRGGSCMI